MSTKIHHDVRAFHRRFGHPVREFPEVPADEEVRFRLRLITEEYRELLAACVADEAGVLAAAFWHVEHAVSRSALRVDLPELADAMADLMYVLEGTAAVSGVDMEPICALVHRANMAKDPVYVAEKDAHHRRPDPAAKPTKPPGWSPPDVRAELLRQGWEP